MNDPRLVRAVRIGHENQTERNCKPLKARAGKPSAQREKNYRDARRGKKQRPAYFCPAEFVDGCCVRFGKTNGGDMNCLAVIQFAVEVLKVEHVIVCGHYGCGGVKAAFDDARYGLVDNWLRPIQDTMHKYEAELEKLSDYETRLDKLCELNVIEQIISVGETTIVQDAWERGQTLFVHGWIYRIAEGIYRDMKITVRSLAELDKMRKETYRPKAETRPVGSVPA